MKKEQEEQEEFTPFPNKKEDIFTSSYHTLFLKEIPPNAIPMNGSDEYFKIINPYTEYNLYLGSFAEKDRGLHELFYILRQSKPSDFLDIRIHSYGGDINEGKQILNIINEYFSGRTRTILDSAGFSMGALAFCMGAERVIYESSTLMLHDYSHMIGGKGGEIESQVLHQSQSIRDFLYSIIVPSGFISDDEFEKMIDGKDFWMDSLEMCVRGIATHIMINGRKVNSDLYVRFASGVINYEEMITGNIKTKKKIAKKKTKKKIAKKKTTKKKTDEK